VRLFHPRQGFIGDVGGDPDALLDGIIGRIDRLSRWGDCRQFADPIDRRSPAKSGMTQRADLEEFWATADPKLVDLQLRLDEWQHFWNNAIFLETPCSYLLGYVSPRFGTAPGLNRGRALLLALLLLIAAIAR
jgi:hypothetical protein